MPLPPPSQLLPDVESASTSDPLMSPTRSLQHSEAQLMARCAAAVEQCRRDLGDLRAACKAAASYREKCTELLGAATEAVVALEDMLYDPGIDLRRERALQQLATRVQAALDQVRAHVGCWAKHRANRHSGAHDYKRAPPPGPSSLPGCFGCLLAPPPPGCRCGSGPCGANLLPRCQTFHACPTWAC